MKSMVVIEDIIDYISGLWAYVMEHEWEYFCYASKDIADRASSWIFPFATIVTKDNEYDNLSNLNRPDMFRINININKEIFDQLITVKKTTSWLGAYQNSGIDFTAVNTIFPHPIYGSMNWISIINPSSKIFLTLQTYLSEWYNNQKKQY